MAESSGRPPRWRRYWLALTGLGVIVLVAAYAVLAATVLPAWIVPIGPGARVDDNTRFNAVVNTRAALLGACG
jgi:hypothetical protein